MTIIGGENDVDLWGPGDELRPMPRSPFALISGEGGMFNYAIRRCRRGKKLELTLKRSSCGGHLGEEHKEREAWGRQKESAGLLYAEGKPRLVPWALHFDRGKTAEMRQCLMASKGSPSF